MFNKLFYFLENLHLILLQEQNEATIVSIAIKMLSVPVRERVKGVTDVFARNETLKSQT